MESTVLNKLKNSRYNIYEQPFMHRDAAVTCKNPRCQTTKVWGHKQATIVHIHMPCRLTVYCFDQPICLSTQTMTRPRKRSESSIRQGSTDKSLKTSKNLSGALRLNESENRCSRQLHSQINLPWSTSDHLP